MIEAGVTDTRKIIDQMHKILNHIPSATIEYISIVDAETLKSVDKVAGKVLAAAAVKIGSTRLIDNILVDAG
jgi:pantoate--beta-alanine ligase